MTGKERLQKRIERAEKKLKLADDDLKLAEDNFNRAKNDRNGKWLKINDLTNSLALIPDDENERHVVETTVAEAGPNFFQTERHRNPNNVTEGWRFNGEYSGMRVGDRIRLEYFFNARRQDKWDVKLLPPPERTEIHELVGYDS